MTVCNISSMLLFQKVKKESKKLLHIEKECLALVLSLQPFEVYVTSSSLPIDVYIVITIPLFLFKRRSIRINDCLGGV